MRLRDLGLRAQELESGPYTFLLSKSTPVAYRDTSTGGPKWYRTEKFFSKGTTRHLNAWLKNKPHAIVPHEQIIAAWEGLSKHAEPSVERRSVDRRQDDSPVMRLAEALAAFMKNGKRQ